jgi:NAD(P)H-dependent flavin oxidoreductase YrpB (nitropropane dioxygenase family)
MLRTTVCDLLGIEHPLVLGGMATGTNAGLVAAVSAAGGLGILGVSYVSAERQRSEIEAIRRLTDRPFGLNHLVFTLDEERFATSLAARPRVISTAWPWVDQDLRQLFERVHEAGALAMHQVSGVPEAERATAAGADVIVAQGTEGGGHVGWMGTMALLPMVVRAVSPLPVLGAGGIADGAGLAAALALGAEGVLLGTRFLATPEAPVPPGYKRSLLDSDGHDTLLTEIPDVANGRVWPGAMSRVRRNRFIERWAGREWELRQLRHEVSPRVIAARQSDDSEEYALMIGQTAGLIGEIKPAADIVREIVEQAEAIIGELRGLARPATGSTAQVRDDRAT